MRERYIPEDNSWIAYSEFDAETVMEAIWQQVDARFPITFDGNRVLIDFDSLPENVSENEVKQAVRDNHPHR